MPGLVAFLASSGVRRRPYPLFTALRRIDPVHRSAIGVWILSRHAEVSSVLRDPRFGSDERKADTTRLNFGPFERLFTRRREANTDHREFLDSMRDLMLFKDPPDHTRLRSLVTKAFTPRRVELLEPRIQAIVGGILDRFPTAGTIDVMSELAYPVPARVICELVGVPAEDQPFIVRLAPDLAAGLDPGPMRTPGAMQRADASMRALDEYLAGLIESRRRRPEDDLLSALIEAEDAGSTLSRDELIGTVGLLLMAGHETTANLVGNGLVALLKDRASFDAFTDAGPTAVEELLRFDPPVQMTVRVALEDVHLGKDLIKKGSIVVAIVAAANRDPEVFTEPNKLDLLRAPNPHLAFSGGAHFCIGAPLARLEGRIVLGELIRRFPNMKLGRAVRRKSFTIRGYSKLEVSTS
jgi:cytochrome P450